MDLPIQATMRNESTCSCTCPLVDAPYGGFGKWGQLSAKPMCPPTCGCTGTHLLCFIDAFVKCLLMVFCFYMQQEPLIPVPPTTLSGHDIFDEVLEMSKIKPVCFTAGAEPKDVSVHMFLVANVVFSLEF